MEERWEHASLLASGPASPTRGGRAAAFAAAPSLLSSAGRSEELEPASPLNGWEESLERRAFRQLPGGGDAVRHSGWLLKAAGDGPQRQWRRRFVYLTADRLCYTPDPDAPGVRYLAVDRIPVRALPRGYGPKLGVALVDDHQIQRPPAAQPFSPKKAGCVFSVTCGAHTHFFAAPSPAEAKAWVEAITDAWVRCAKHTTRGTHLPSAEEALAVKEARWRADGEALRRSLADAEQQRLRESTAQWQAAAAAALAQPVDQPVACYELELATGSHPEAGTTAKVYLELCGEGGSSGEHRLMYREGASPPRPAFAAGAVDAFRLHCSPLGHLVKARVFHNNAGASPAWLLEEVRVRRQGDPAWTVFPCGRWLSVSEDDGRIMRELSTTAPPAPAPAAAQQQAPPAAAAAERVTPMAWYTIAVCTSGDEGAGLAPPKGPHVSMTLHGARGSSQRVQLPSQAGDFGRAQEDVFRVQLPGVGALEKLTVGLGGPGADKAAWLLEQVEVTDEGTGETTYFACGAWLGGAKGAAERSLLGSRSNPREARLEATVLRQQAEAAKRQLAEAQAELSAARSAVSGAVQASAGAEADLNAKLSALQEEVRRLQAALAEAQQRAAAAEARVLALQGELSTMEERAAGLQREQEAGKLRSAADAARTAELSAQLQALQNELALAQSAAASAASRARQFEAEAQRSEEALEELGTQHERFRRQNSSKAGDADGELARLRAEVAARVAELREAKHAEEAAEAECARLGKELAAERLRVKEAEENAARAAAAASHELDAAPSALAATAKLQASYRVRIHTSSEPSGAGTCRPVCLELMGSAGSTGPIRLDGASSAAGPCFAAGGCDVFQLEAAGVGELRQLNVWVDMEGSTVGVAPSEAAWHLDFVEVACLPSSGSATAPGSTRASATSGSARASTTGAASAGLSGSTAAARATPPPTFFVCRKWLDDRCGYRAELLGSARDPRQGEVEYRVVVHTASQAGCGTAGNVFVDLQGERAGASSGVLTLRNKGGSFRPSQADEFAFRLPALGALSELRVGHDGRREWRLERVEVTDGASGTTYFFPCAAAVKGSGSGGAMVCSLQLRGYTTDPASLPVQYRAELLMEGASGPLGPGSLRMTLFGARGDTGPVLLDPSGGGPGCMLACVFEAPNVGAMERLRIGLALAEDKPGLPRQAACALLLPRVSVTNMVTGEAAYFYCAEWLRSIDAFDFELDAEGEQEEAAACRYRLEVQTSDVRKAGTSSSVFMTLVGDAGAIGPYQLANTESEHFQRGQLDVFEIDGAPDCGRLQQIEVRHDGAGKSESWHLAWVKASNCTTGAVAMFRCNRWVDRREPQDRSVVAVVVALPPQQQAAAAHGQRSVKDRLLLGGGGKAALLAATTTATAAASAPPAQDVRMEADLMGGSPAQVLGMGPAGGAEAAALPGYRVVFHTSRICGSGTKAKVHFELTGSRGSSGVLHPIPAKRSFGAGRMDVFDYPALPFLGELQSARVGTDGSGFFPAWHLQLVMVTHLPTGRVWQFSCFNWIDRRCKHSRWLTLDCVEERAVYGTPGAGASAAKLAGGAASHSASPGILAGGPKSSPGQQLMLGNGDGSMEGYGIGAQRSLQFPTAPGTYYRQAASPSGSPTAGGSPLRPKLQQSPLAAGMQGQGSPGLQARAYGSSSPARAWSPATHAAMLRSGSGMPGSPLIGARR